MTWIAFLRAVRPVAAGALLVAATAGVHPTASSKALDGASHPVVTLAVNGRANAYASIASDREFVAIAWGATVEGGVTDIYAAVSRNAGRTFGGPVRVSQAGSEARLSGEQPPRVALVHRDGAIPSIVVVWTGKGASGTRLASARSDDGGRSFGRPATVVGTDAPGNRGWESVAVDPNGQVAAVWLDHREVAAAGTRTAPMVHDGQAHAGHGGAADGASKAQLSKLYFARLDGSGDARAVTGGVCYCCKTSLATGSDGAFYAAWRHVYPGNVRDIAFTVSRDAGRTFAPPARVSDDRWVLDGCPENGPSLAVDSRNRVHVVWPTLVEGSTASAEPTLALYYAASNDGLAFTPRLRIPTDGMPRHVQMAAASDDSLVLVWDEQTGSGARRVVMGRLRGAQPSFASRALSGNASGTYPVVAAVAGASVVAWASSTDGGSVIQVTRVEESGADGVARILVSR